MNLGLDVSLRLSQKLSFQMIQSLKLLQVNTLQLEQVLRTELEQNPLLEIDEEIDQTQEQEREKNDEKEDAKENQESSTVDDVAENTSEELEVSEDTVDWEEYLDEGFDLGYSRSEEVDKTQEHFEPTNVYQGSLIDYLNNQIAEKKIPERKKLLIQFIIGSLDADGYLRLPTADIADVTKVDPMEVEEAIQFVRQMDPPGICARNLQECLLLQLNARGLGDSLAAQIITHSWTLFEKLKIPELARTYGIAVTDVQKAIETIKQLNPKPGYAASEEKSTTIIPDLIVEKIDGEFVVMLNDRSIPSLMVNKSYLNLVRRGSTASKEIKTYVRNKLNSATWFIRAIEQRKTTMVRVMTAIVEKQKEFFEKGPPNLSPLKLQDIAEMVAMHISTISRVTSGKYVQSPYGIYELKHFFTEDMGHDADGGAVSSERIRSRIKQLVENEVHSRPLSDQQIADILTRENIAAARRTVAKYREQLKILPARMRLKYE